MSRWPAARGAGTAATTAATTGATTGARLLVALLALAGLVLVARGLWIPAKAVLGQVLLERAWQGTLAGPPGEVHRPWPWADTAPVARLALPEHGHSWVVLEGVSGEALAWGPGWMRSSAPPGQAGPTVRPAVRPTARPAVVGPTVLAGHRDTHFRVLQHLRPGDPVELETSAGLRRYRVTTAGVVDSADPAAVARVLAGEVGAGAAPAGLVLVTCYPFEALDPGGPLRWVVMAVGLPAGRVTVAQSSG